jgi:hypothetical protein
MGQCLDFTRERSGKHEGLPLVRQCLHDSPNRRKKSHVEHAIGLVQHHEFDPGKIGRALLHQIDQTTRRSHDHVDPGTQRFNLRAFTHSAEDGGQRKGTCFA